MSKKLPQGWKKLSIDDVLIDKISGEWGKECENENEGVYVLRTTNFTNEGKLKLDEVVKRNIEEKKVDKKKLKYGDIILEKSGGSENQPVGRVVYFDIQSEDTYLCNNFTQILRPNTEIINSKYLLYVLFDIHRKGITEYFQNKTTGIRNLQTKSYLEQKIKIPTLKEQERIVSILERAEDAICKREESNRLLDEYLKSVFVDMFGDPIGNSKGWKKKKMNDVAPVVNYKGDFNEEKIWLLNLDMVESNTGNIIDYNYVLKEDIGNSTCTFDTTNVLYSKLRPYLNKVVIPNEIGYATSEMVPLQPLGEILNRYYLTYMLRNKSFVDYISEKVSGAKMPRVTMNDFRDFDVPIPSIELQNEFENLVKQVDKMKLKMENSLEELQNNFNSLMQRAFNGELF